MEEPNAIICIFATKDQSAWKNPLDVKGSQVKGKTIHELVVAIHKRVYSSDNEEEEWNFLKDSNKVVVKEDVGCKGDCRQNGEVKFIENRL